MYAAADPGCRRGLPPSQGGVLIPPCVRGKQYGKEQCIHAYIGGSVNVKTDVLAAG